MATPNPPSLSSSSACPTLQLLLSLYGPRLRTLHDLLVDLFIGGLSSLRAPPTDAPDQSSRQANLCAPRVLEERKAPAWNMRGRCNLEPEMDPDPAAGASEMPSFADLHKRTTLPEFCCDASQSTERAGGEIGLIRAGDCVEYVTLLMNSYAVLGDNASPMRGSPTNQHWSQQQVVERVIELQFRKEGSLSNVLCLGYGQLQPTRSRGEHLQAPQGLEYKYFNAAVESVTSHLWATLLSRVGDEAMLHVLSHSAIFVPLPQHCFLQVAGPPISIAACSRKQFMQTPSAFGTGEHKKKRCKREGLGQDELMIRVRDTIMKKIDDGSISAKRVRPSSWQRRKRQAEQRLLFASPSSSAKMFMAAAGLAYTAEETSPALSSTEMDNSCDSIMHLKDPRLTKKDASYIITKSKRISKEKPCHKQGKGLLFAVPENETKLGMAGVHALKKSKLAHQGGPSCRFINRAPIFYSSSFTCHAGLPANHILNTTHPSQTGIDRLFASIFERVHSRVTYSSLAKDAVKHTSESFKETEMITDTKALVGKLIRNSKHCGYARLLSRHCPLPPHLQPSCLRSESLVACSEVKAKEQSLRYGSDRLTILTRFTEEVGHCQVFKWCRALCIRHAPVRTKFELEHVRLILRCLLYKRNKRYPLSELERLIAISAVRRINEGTFARTKLPNLPSDGYATQKEDLEKESLLFSDDISNPDTSGSNRMFNSYFSKQPAKQENYDSSSAFCTPSQVVRSHDNTFSKQVLSGMLEAVTPDALKPEERCSRASLPNSQPEVKGKCQVHRTAKENSMGGSNQLGHVESISVSDLITCSTGHSQVTAFLWAVCRSLIPKEFLGSTLYWRRLYSSIACFVGLRRHEAFSIQHILTKLRLSGCTWLKGGQPAGDIQAPHKLRNFHVGPNLSSRVKTEDAVTSLQLIGMQQLMLEDWLFWMFSNLIVPLIKGHFYVTESENRRQNVFYYRKPVWAKIQLLSLRELTSRCYTKLDRSSVAAALQKRSLGFSHIRLLPKQNGVRPISNLSAASKCALPSIERSRDGNSKATSESYRYSCRSVGNFGGDCSLNLPHSNHSRHALKYGKNQVKFAFKSVNSVLKDTHVCLKYEQEHHSEDLGSSVFGYKDAYVKLLPFILHLKNSQGGLPPLYMAVCDISRAYDTIQQEKLFEVVCAFLRLPVYVVLRYSSVFQTMGSLRVAYKRACTDSCQPLELFNSLSDATAKHSHSVLQDQAVVKSMLRDQILAVVEEHVKRNIVKIGSHYYLQKLGIPQGSVLSSLLCSVFFGHLETHLLSPYLQNPAISSSNSFEERGGRAEPDCGLQKPETIASVDKFQLTSSDRGESLESEVEDMLVLLEQQGLPTESNPHCKSEVARISPGSSESILLRLIDDSLFISTSKDAVEKFVGVMHQGFEDYGCHANRGKTAVSFNLQLHDDEETVARKVYVTDNGACFIRWSGLLINCRTLEIQADYTRYIGEAMKATLTVVRKKNFGIQIPFKLCHFMRAKCYPLLYDRRINSPSTVRLNAYQAFLLCAMKFHSYLSDLPRTTLHHSPFLLRTVVGTSRYMYGLLKKKMQEIGASIYMEISQDEVEWLALVAFHKILFKKQSRYLELLSFLQARLRKPNFGSMNSCPYLSSAIDEQRSSMFKCIVY